MTNRLSQQQVKKCQELTKFQPFGGIYELDGFENLIPFQTYENENFKVTRKQVDHLDQVLISKIRK